MIQKNNYIKLSGNKLPLIIQYLKLYISEIYKYIMRIINSLYVPKILFIKILSNINTYLIFRNKIEKCSS